MKRIGSIILIAVIAGLSGGCGPLFKIRKAMYDQEKLEPLEATPFFANGAGSRELVEGTVPRGWLKDNDHLYLGKVDGADVSVYPFEIGEAEIRRGQERYNIYCAVCHGEAGYGDGMVAQRGFKHPPSFHSDDFRKRNAKPGTIYGVIANGFGVMNDYADQIPVEDRWMIAAYVEVLLESQNFDLDKVPEDAKATLGAQE